MSKIELIGTTLADLAKATGTNFLGWVVFLLRDKDDDTGARICEAFTLREILRKHPEVSSCIVKYAYDYYGQTILRVIAPRNRRKK